MKPTLIVAIVAGVVIPLQTATLGYVLKIEHRITQLETMAALRGDLPRLGQQQQYEHLPPLKRITE